MNVHKISFENILFSYIIKHLSTSNNVFSKNFDKLLEFCPTNRILSHLGMIRGETLVSEGILHEM